MKSAALSAAALVATTYAFAYDMVAIAIPVEFLARDQIRCGFLRAEQTIAIGLFAVTFAVFMAFGDRQSGVTFGSVPLAPIVISTLLCAIVRRARRSTACA